MCVTRLTAPRRCISVEIHDLTTTVPKHIGKLCSGVIYDRIPGPLSRPTAIPVLIHLALFVDSPEHVRKLGVTLWPRLGPVPTPGERATFANERGCRATGSHATGAIAAGMPAQPPRQPAAVDERKDPVLMRTRSKLIFVGLAATLLMSFAVGTTSANRLSSSSSNLYRFSWPDFRFFAEEGTELGRCPVTLEGSFHSATIRKVRGALVGFISRASVRGAEAAGNCTGGTATIEQASLPWHVTYDSFTGTLPRPTGIVFLFHRLNFRLAVRGVACLYGENGVERARGTANIEPNGLVTGLSWDPTPRLARLSGIIVCPARLGLGGTSTVRALPGGGNIFIRLI